MDYLVLTMIAFALIISGVATVFLLQAVFDRVFDQKMMAVYNQMNNFVNGHVMELQKQIYELKLKRGKCERCEKSVPAWDQTTDPGINWDKQTSRQRGGNTWPTGPKRDSSQERY